MVPTVIATELVNVITTCAGSFCCCSKAKEYLRKEQSDYIREECRVHFRAENKTEREPTDRRSFIAQVQQADISEKFESKRSNGEKIALTELKGGTISSSKEVDVVPIKPPRRRRRINRKCDDARKEESSTESRYSSTSKGSTNTSSVTDNVHGGKRVTAQIHVESHSRGIASPASKEILNSLKSESTSRDVNSVSGESTLKPSGGERSSMTSVDTKNDSLEKAETRKTMEDNKTEGSSLRVPQQSSSQHQSTKDRSMLFQISRMDNASTSTKINSQALLLKEFDSEQIASVQESWKRSSGSAEEYSITILKEVLSFLSLEEKDCALELCTSRTRKNDDVEEGGGAYNVTQDDDSRIITIQVRKYHRMKDEHGFQNKVKSFESHLTKVYGRLSGKGNTANDSKGSGTSSRSKEESSTMDGSSYYKIRLSTMDQAILEKKKSKKNKNEKKKKSSWMFSRVFQW